MTANQIAYSKHLEEARHNRVSERHEHYDTRSRRMQAEAAGSQAQTAAYRADTERQQLGVNWWLAQEQQRAAMAKESETYRHNYQQEQIDMYKSMTAASAAQDQARAALQQAAVARTNATTRQNELAESIRHSSVLEGQSQSQLIEQVRRNKASEAINYAQIGESRRASRAQEALTSQRISEETRHNLESEKVATSKAMTDSKRVGIDQQRAYNEAGKTVAMQDQATAALKRADTDEARMYLEAAKTGTAIAKDIASTIGGFFK